MRSPLTPDQCLKLIKLQMELECVRVVDGNIMLPFDCPNPDTPPRVLVARIGDDYRLFVRHDIPGAQRIALEAKAAKDCFLDESPVIQILGGSDDVWRNQGYVLSNPIVPDSCGRATRLPDLTDQGFPVFGIIEDCQIISSCSSSREIARSAEAWVYTDERYRGRGLAAQVVSAWASDLQLQEKTSFYSHLLDNAASQTVATKLGANLFASEVGYS